MLNGLDPILIFSFYKNIPDKSKSVIAKKLGLTRLSLPPIPIYLSETLTGLYIESEDKNIDIQTNTDTLASGDDPLVTQKGIGVVTTIKFVANKDSIGLTLLSALSEIIFKLVTSGEYAITYFHGATTLFGGRLHGFQVQSESDTDKVQITIELIKGNQPGGAVDVGKVNGTASLQGGKVVGGTLPGGGGFTPRPGSVPVGSAP